MTRVDAIYQDGVFKPLGPLVLPENQRVLLEVESAETEDALAWLERVSKARQEFTARHGI